MIESHDKPVIMTCYDHFVDFGLGSRNRPLKQSTSQEVCRIAGFALLPSLLQKHIEIVDLYLLLLGLMFGHPPKPIPEAIKVIM